MRHTAYLSLGSSQGDRKYNLQTAVEKIGLSAGRIISVSPVYETEPWGFSMKSSFLNMAVTIQTGMSPRDLLQTLLETEKSMGRLRSKKSDGYSSRIIDIDILFYNDIVINEPGITIPHPLAHLRKFVLAPLNDISPRLEHPVLKKKICELNENCTDSCKVIRYDCLT